MPLVNTAQTLGPAASTCCSPSMFAPSRSASPFRVFRGEEERPLPDPSAPACVPGGLLPLPEPQPKPQDRLGSGCGPPTAPAALASPAAESSLAFLSLSGFFSASLSGVSLPSCPQALSPTVQRGSSGGRSSLPRAGEGAVGIAVPDPAAKPAADEPPAPPGLAPSTAGGFSALGTPVPRSPQAPLSVHVPPSRERPDPRARPPPSVSHPAPSLPVFGSAFSAVTGVTFSRHL